MSLCRERGRRKMTPTVNGPHVSPDSGERTGGPVHSSKTSADGRWGPANVDPSWYLEMVLTSPGEPITHIYRSPFPRSSDVVHLRAAKPLGAADAGAGSVVILTRPRGYFGLPRDVVLFDGKEPADVKPGVPTDSTSTLRLPAGEVGRPVATMREVDDAGRRRIVEMMWEMVFADGKVTEFEDNVLWRAADLLGISGRDRIDLKHQVQERQAARTAGDKDSAGAAV